MDIIHWFQENWSALLEVLKLIALAYATLVAAATIVVRITPTLKDDTILLKVIKFVAKYVALARTIRDDIIRQTLK